ncbi:hypothetical protein GF376_01675 [Candidatus Peregrinibacteria bacterium]|nr:hypothetical protein [Candidatus Peregrinibacteria bacterium]
MIDEAVNALIAFFVKHLDTSDSVARKVVKEIENSARYQLAHNGKFVYGDVCHIEIKQVESSAAYYIKVTDCDTPRRSHYEIMKLIDPDNRISLGVLDQITINGMLTTKQLVIPCWIFGPIAISEAGFEFQQTGGFVLSHTIEDDVISNFVIMIGCDHGQDHAFSSRDKIHKFTSNKEPANFSVSITAEAVRNDPDYELQMHWYHLMRVIKHGLEFANLPYST